MVDVQGLRRPVPAACRRRKRQPRGWAVVSRVNVLAGCVLLVAFAAVPGEVGRYGAYVLCAGAAALGVRRGMTRHRPAYPMGWRLVEIGLWFHAGYGLVGLGTSVLPGRGWEPAEVVVDTAGHAAIAAAALVFLARRRPGADRDGLIDLVTVLVAGGLLAWQVIARSLLPGDLTSAGPVAVALLMAATLVVGIRLHPARHRSGVVAVLAVALVLALVGDVAEVVAGGASRAVESLWLLAALLVAGVALHPGMRQLTEPEQSAERRVSTVRLLGLGAALLINPLLVVLPHPPSGSAALWLGLGVGVLTLLVLWRIGRLVTDRERARRQLVEQIAQRDVLAGALQHAATHDGLTGLPNRAVLVGELTAALARPPAPAVLFLDLDGFKPVNDQLGHAAGDELLVGVAGRLRACLRGGDLAARIGGDEFALLVRTDPERSGISLSDPDRDPAKMVADRVVAALGAPFALTAGTVTIGVSIGMTSSGTAGGNITGGGEHPVTAEQLLHRADQAMYAAKRAGKGRLALK